MGRIARQTIGVTGVANSLEVVPTAGQGQAVGDAELASRVARQIASAIPGAKSGQDWWLDGWRGEGANNLWSFTVEAEEGRVYLDGEVPRLAIMRQAVDAARQTAGVESVQATSNWTAAWATRMWAITRTTTGTLTCMRTIPPTSSTTSTCCRPDAPGTGTR